MDEDNDTLLGRITICANELARRASEQQANEPPLAIVRAALVSARDFLEECYEVTAYPGNGTSIGDRVLAEVKTALVELDRTSTG